MLIPRGGAGLIRSVVENARVPVIETGAGNCHVYVDEARPDLDMAASIIYNAKCSRPSVCNAAETHAGRTGTSAGGLPAAGRRRPAGRQAGCELRGCPRDLRHPARDAEPATEADWDTEYWRLHPRC